MNKEILRKNLDDVIWKIERARLSVSEHHIVQMVAVGKYTTTENIKTLYSLGQRAFGENHVQQLEIRARELEDLPLEWHMIGTLQKNKINKLLDIKPSLFQALDSFELAYELQDKLSKREQNLSVLLEINSSKETTKSGFDADRSYEAYLKIQQECPNIKLQGVMTIGAHTDNAKIVQNSFETTYRIYEKLQSTGANICSMGMSSDFELAIKCGSNMIRIGSILFEKII